MTDALTDKTRVVITRLGDYWVTPSQATAIALTLEDNPQGSIELNGDIIRCSAIDGVLSPENYSNLNLKRQGGYQCRYQHWHGRGESCAHGQLRR